MICYIWICSLWTAAGWATVIETWWHVNRPFYSHCSHLWVRMKTFVNASLKYNRLSILALKFKTSKLFLSDTTWNEWHAILYVLTDNIDVCSIAHWHSLSRGLNTDLNLPVFKWFERCMCRLYYTVNYILELNMLYNCCIAMRKCCWR